MKTARRVEVPEDRPLTEGEYKDLLSHAVNSALWYVERNRSTSKQVKERLYRKGYPRHSVLVRGSDRTYQVDFALKVVKKLTELAFLDDKQFAEDFVESRVAQGQGLQKIKVELQRKGITPELIEEALEKASQEDQREALRKALERAKNSSSYRNAKDAFTAKQKLMRTLVAKGFSYGDIAEVLEELAQEEEDDSWMI